MPTGYTAGIIDGTTEKFQDFAKLCIRAFGATVHMRDEPFDKCYEPRTPSDYHLKALNDAKEKLKKAESFTDKELIKMRKKELEKSRDYHIKRIAETKVISNKLESFLKEAKGFVVPTSEHEAFKKFMVEQLESTIKHDGDSTYHEKLLPEIEEELKNINASVVRFSLIEDANRDIAYHLKEYKAELNRCAESNAWVESLFSSLK